MFRHRSRSVYFSAAALTMVEHLARVVLPAAYSLLPEPMASREASVLLVAIALQESKCQYRRQVRGPAVGFWQFEKGGGVRGVLTHPQSERWIAEAMRTLAYPATADAAHDALPHNDTLAAVFARLLLWTDPAPLPDVGLAGPSWDLYLRCWRPGRPHPETWIEHYAQAMLLFVGT